jgi:hypothetical protein
VLAGAAGIASSLGGRRLTIEKRHDFAWDARYLYLSAREPWRSTTSAAGITFGRITPRAPLRLLSQMPENVVVFSDGIEADFLQLRSGTQATIGLARRQGELVAYRAAAGAL